ncbi:MAG: stress response translation initiation inhibitor YciH [Candidatus Eremiobacteraeota bacterium]|nr:stress response translation initiation inhibitor YciH [Candidatus Eremiobacteraeota bacterium]
MTDDRQFVYSSDGGPNFSERKSKVRPPVQKSGVPDDGVIRVWRERRRASTVTLVTGLRSEELHGVAKALKAFCATGGSAKDSAVHLQGDQREKVVTFFGKEGRRVKRAGG